MKTSLKFSLVASAIAAIPFVSHAAGLGGINVFSGLGQPLRAEIELQATPQELQSISARVPSADVFRQSNVSYSPLMLGLQLSVETRGNRSVLRVSSDRPINEPFLDMLVELNWASGRLLREYTFLLDPVGMTAPPVAALVDSPSARPAPAARPAAAPAASSVPGGEHRVQRGDTLGGIASANRPPGTSVDQMLIALLRQNPAAFDDGNMNRLRAGAILSMPDQATVQAVDPTQARREIVAQAADFEAYRSRLAGTVAARPETPQPEGSRESGGTIAPRVEDAARSEPVDRVELSGAAGDAEEPGRLARLQALEEELVSRDKELEEANSRIAALERSVRDFQRLLELRSENMAQFQEQLGTDADPLTLLLPENLSEVATGSAESESQPAEPAADAEPAAEPQPEPKPSVQPEPPVVAQAPESMLPAERSADIPLPPDTVVQPSFVQTLMKDPTLLAGGGAILALLLGYTGYRMRERRKAEEALDSMSNLTDYPSEGESVFGAQGGQSIDTGSSSVLHSDFSQSGMSAIDADEGVDPVAEADVYMAYGRDVQAEEILLDALKADPSRSAIYLKLLEVYAHRGSRGQFEAVATDLYSRIGGGDDDWLKAAAMGRKLDPENPLYAVSDSPAASNEPQTEQGRARSEAASGAAVAAAVSGAAAAAAGMTGRGDSAENESEPVAEADQAPALDEIPGGREDLDFSASDPFSTVAGQKDTWTVPGDISKLTQNDDDVAAEQGDDAAPEIDFSVLDFDIGKDETAPAGQTESVEKGEPDPRTLETTAGVGGDLMFDLDMSDDAGTGKVEGAEDGDAAAELPAVEESDASIDSEAVDTADSESMKATFIGSELDPSLSDELYAEVPDENAKPAGLATGADLNATVIQQGEFRVDDEDSSVMDLEQTSFDNSLLDFDFDLSTSPDDGGPEAPAIDLSNIDLDLELPEEAAAPGPSVPEVENLPAAASSAMSADALQEVDTKLDLARAYEEMGDKEGARELLEEVLREGTEQQRDSANRLMERLG